MKEQTLKKSGMPFIPVREVILYCPNYDIWNSMTPELKKKYFMCYWSDERIRQHVAMLHAGQFPTVVYNPAHTAGLETSVYKQVLEGLKNKFRNE